MKYIIKVIRMILTAVIVVTVDIIEPMFLMLRLNSYWRCFCIHKDTIDKCCNFIKYDLLYTNQDNSVLRDFMNKHMKPIYNTDDMEGYTRFIEFGHAKRDSIQIDGFLYKHAKTVLFGIDDELFHDRKPLMIHDKKS